MSLESENMKIYHNNKTKLSELLKNNGSKFYYYYYINININVYVHNK